MKLTWRKVKGKWKRRWTLDVDEWLTLIILLLGLNYIMIRLLIGE